MKNKDNKTEDLILRQKAEELLKRKPAKPGSTLSETETLGLLHELELHKIERELQHKEIMLSRSAANEAAEKYNELYDYAPVGYFTLTKAGEIIELNICGANMLGKERSHILNRLFGFYVSGDTRAIFNHFLEKIFTGETQKSCEVALSVQDGLTIFVLLTAIIAKNNKQCIVTAIDITHRKKSSEALQESEAMFRNLVERMPDGVYKSTHDGKFVNVNPAIVSMLGYADKEELLAIDIKTQLYLEASDRESLVLQEKSEEMGVYQLKKKDGTTIWVEDHGWYNMDENGNILFHEGIMRNITERKIAEEALRESEERFKKLFEEAPLGIALIDSLTGYICEVNPMFASIAGRTMEEMTHIDWKDITHPDDIQPDLDNMVLLNARKISGYHIEKRYFHKDNTMVWVSMTVSSLNVIDKTQPRHLCMIQDITERKQAEDELKLKNKELQKVNAEKDKYFSLIAHDLRSPFNAFLGSIEMMVEELDDMTLKEIQALAEGLKKSALNLHSLLENLLEWSQIERGIISFNPKLCLLRPKITESLQTVMDTANKKSIEIMLNIPDDMEVFADENMLKSTIRNLAGNAVKFTSPGGQIMLAAKQAEHNFVEISIGDNGIGMSKDRLDKLFNIDGHTSRPGTEGEPSTGLGLILCKEFVEKHSGSIWVESIEGNGTTICFTIPCSDQIAP